MNYQSVDSSIVSECCTSQRFLWAAYAVRSVSVMWPIVVIVLYSRAGKSSYVVEQSRLRITSNVRQLRKDQSNSNSRLQGEGAIWYGTPETPD